eukprot:TRINITY_DN48023_c0_g1_i1.p1 TRINITY_DN48023_c0_g1~~TRINITY_DN48023_c0_g1_i1.p1  ORF type:complete len:271 (-),score=52.98 TRINITY_DN48023_c0_g1_i1:7-819(-)
MSAMMVVDLDSEELLRHFCIESECDEILRRFKDNGFARPEEFKERLALAKQLREGSNEHVKAEELESAMIHALWSLHCLDFSRARTTLQSDEEQQQVLESLVPLLCNLSLIFLKRKDAHNVKRAADLGLYRVELLSPDSTAKPLKAKLLFRRALGRGLAEEYEEAFLDLKEAIKIAPTDPDVRRALGNCKTAIKCQRGAPDDKWRGLLTEETTRKVKLKAQVRRWYRDTKEWFYKADHASDFLLNYLCPLLVIFVGYVATRLFRYLTLSA